jgi:hypothetical protein
MEIKFNYILESSNNIKLLGKLTDKNHLFQLRWASPVDFDKKIYELYKTLGIFEDALLTKFFEGDVIDKEFQEKGIGVENGISSWDIPGTPKNIDQKPLDIAIYIAGETLESPFYWEPVVEQKERIAFFLLVSSKIKERTKNISLPFSLLRNKLKGRTNYNYGYIDGRRHHLGAYRENGMQSCSNYVGYEMWQEFFPEFTIALKEENGSTERN